jgi:hypothetical protein
VRTKRRIEISVERNEFLVITQPDKLMPRWCESCAGTVLMVTPAEAAVVAGVSWREISRRVEAGRVHFIETPDGLLLICINSVSQ